jgi:uncharacterized membrane protein YesL
MPKAEKPRQEHIFSKSEDENHHKPRTFKERFMDFYYDAIPYFTLNMAWFVMSLPLVTFFPALGGLYAAALTFNQESRADWSTVWEGFKKYWWLSLRWGLLVLFGDVILAVNIWFYLNMDQNWAVIALMLAIMISIFWMAIHQFSFPLLLLQDEKKILLAIRNGYVVIMRQPLAALKVMLLSLVISVLSILLPPLWIFVSMALIVQLRTRTVLKAVKRINEKDADRGSVKTHQQGENSDQ